MRRTVRLPALGALDYPDELVNVYIYLTMYGCVSS
jgi:hypothetical protein